MSDKIGERKALNISALKIKETAYQIHTHPKKKKSRI